MAEIHPHTRAVVYPAGRAKNGRTAYSHRTFQQLDQQSDRLAVFQRAAAPRADHDRRLRPVRLMRRLLDATGKLSAFQGN